MGLWDSLKDTLLPDKTAPPRKPVPKWTPREDPNVEARKTQEAVFKGAAQQQAQQREEMLGKPGAKAPEGFSAKAEKQAKMDDAELRDRMRDPGLGRKPGEELKPGDLETETRILTDAEYNAMNPNSRYGADANTIIIEALKTGDVDAELKKRLKQLRLPSGKRVLDEYTSLEALVDEQDIKNVLSDEGIAKTLGEALPRLSPFSRPAGESVFKNPRASMVIELSEAARSLSKRLPKNALRAGFDVAAAVARNEEASVSTPGFGDTKMDIEIQKMYDLFSTKSTALDELQAHLAEGPKVNPEGFSAFMEYAKLRSQNEKNYAIKPGKGRRTPEEIRKLLGLDRGEDNG